MDYEIDIDENLKRNKKFLKGFEKYLKDKKLSKRTIEKHVDNIDLYINDYLPYYEGARAEDGTSSIFIFLSGWFIEKCMWVTETSLKEMGVSLKKFYHYMFENKYTDLEDYEMVCFIIKDKMDYFLEKLYEFDNIDDEFY